MKSLPRLSQAAAVISTAALICFSANSFAKHKHHRVYHRPVANYKAETVQENYKGEVTAPAVVCPTERCLAAGPYVGIGVGYDAYRVKQSSGISAINGVAFNMNPSLNAQGWMGNLFVGYGQYFDMYYMAGEIFGSLSSAKVSNSVSATATSSYNNSFSVRGSYGVSLLPGIKVNPSTLIYGRIGYTRTSFKINENATSGIVSTSNSLTEWDNGLNYGIGTEAAVYDNFSVRGDFVHTQYNSFKSVINSKFKPSNNEFSVGVIYHFG